jgi:predicted ATPase/class 3 adenylate cyclase/predicted negative regulator of RcsB-dependent stress response
MNHPSGTVTFLFTDIQGSTRLWQEEPAAMVVAHARHNAILRNAIETNHGYVFQVIGDAFCAAFHTAQDALRASLKAQTDLHNASWGDAIIKVRMGIHTGEAELQEGGDYRGFLTMSRLQRLMSAAHGGQTLLSLATQELLQNSLPTGVSLHDMGARRLKDWNRPEQIFQLVVEGLPSEFPPLRTLDASRHNLPAPTTSFIGRKKEKVEIKQAIGAHRLVTLTGSGGTGKTRLSLQVAVDLLDQFADGIWFVELAPLTDSSLIPQTILTAMEASEQQDKTPAQALIERVRGKKLLLILDNCEHLIEAVAKLVESLLSNAPELKVMASSREALGVKGEMAWHVPSMSVPDAKSSTSLDEFSRLESVRLFIERAILAKPHFQLTKDNASSVAQICSRLDGIPLAIELAAARVRALSVEQIAARLVDRFHLLMGGSRTALPRQQTLRAMIDWSFNLLSEQEKQLFRRLAVFVGGWTLEAAEQVCVQERSELDILELLTHLVDKSLVNMEESAEDVRYRMLETTRQYAREMLMMSEETRIYRDQHLEYFLKYAETAQLELRGRKQAEWMSLLETEHDNLRAALEWSQGTRPELGLRIAVALIDFWDTHGHLTEARRWLETMLQKTAHLDPSPARVDALLGAMAFAIRQTDLEISRKLLEDGLALARAIDYNAGIARGLMARGVVAEYFEGDFEKAEEYYNAGLDIYRRTGDNLAIGQALGPLASCALKRYEFSHAEKLYRESLSLFREVENEREIAGALENLAEVALERRNYTDAHSLAEESLSLYRKLEDKHGIATALRALGVAAHNQKNLELARSSCEQSDEIFRELGDRGCLILSLAALARQLQHLGELQRAFDIIQEARKILDGVEKELVATNVFDVFGRIAFATGNLSEAQRQFRDGLAFQQEGKDVHFVPSHLEGLAGLIEPQDAIRLLGAAAIMREKTNVPLMRIGQGEYERTIAALKSRVNDADFRSLWEEGLAMTVDEAILFALEKGGT